MERVFGIRIDESGSISVLNRLDDGVNKLSKSTDKLDRNIDSNNKTMASSGRAADALRRNIVSLAAVSSAAVFGAMTKGAVETAKEFQSLNRILNANQLGFVRAEADRLGLSLLESAQGFAKLTAATKGTALEGRATQEIFTGLSTAVSGLSLSQEKANGALTAFEQIASKGTVQAEELRGQLGERIPGAFQIAARAMNLTTQELGKQLELGNVLAEDFLPKFAKELEKTYSSQALTGARELNAEQNRLSTSLQDLQLSFANSGPLDSYTNAIRSLKESLSSDGAIGAVESMGSAVAFLIDNFTLLAGTTASVLAVRTLAPAFSSVAASITAMRVSAAATPAAFNLMNVGMASSASAATALTLKQQLLTKSTALMSSSMALLGGPAGVAILAAGALFTMAGRATDAEKSIASMRQRLDGLGGAIDGTKIKNKELAESFRRLQVKEAVDAMVSLQAEFTQNNAAIDEAKLKLKELGVAAGELGSGFSSQGGLSKEIEDLNTKVKVGTELQESLRIRLGVQREFVDELSKSHKDLSESQEKSGDEAKKYSSTVEKILKTESDRIKSIDEINKAISEGADVNGALTKKLKELNGEAQKDLELTNRRKSAWKSFTGVIDEQFNAYNDALRVFGGYKTAAEQVDDALGRISTKQYVLNETIGELNRRLESGAISQQRYKELLDELGVSTEQFGASTENTGDRIGQLWEQTTDSIYSAWEGFFRDGLDGWDSFADSIEDTFKDLIASLLAQWAASGIAGLFAGDGFSGFSFSNAFGSSDGQGFDFSSIFGSQQTQQAAGAVFGQQAGQTFNSAVSGAGGALGVVGGVNQIDQGLEQGGTTGALSVVSGISSVVTGAQQAITAFNAISGAASAAAASAAQASAANAAAAGFFGTGGTVATTTATTAATTTAAVNTGVATGTAIGTTGAGTGAATTGGSTALGSAASAAGWIALAIAADQILLDGAIGEAGFSVWDARREDYEGGLEEIAKSQLSLEYPKIFLENLFGARDFDQILNEDYLPDLLGRADATGATGGFGFAGGGNTGIFGSNFGISGSGLNAQLLADGGANGNGGFITGAQSSLDAFAELAQANGFRVDQANGVLRVLSFDQTVEDIQNLWSEFNDGLEEAVSFSEIFDTAIENNLIQPTNLFFENFALGFGQSAFEARDAILQIDREFDLLVSGGEEASQALITSLSNFYGISEENAVQFVARSGVELDQWVSNFQSASDDALIELLEFNQEGVTLFEGISAASQSAANVVQATFQSAIGGVSSSLSNLSSDTNRALSAIGQGISNNGGSSRASIESLGQFNSALGSSKTITVPQSSNSIGGGDSLFTVGLVPRREEFSVSKTGTIDGIANTVQYLASKTVSSGDEELKGLLRDVSTNINNLVSEISRDRVMIGVR